jgi:proliferating cell nuclear antigen
MSTDSQSDSNDVFTATATQEAIADLIDPISRLTDECKIRLNDDGFQIKAVDPANVAMGQTNLSADSLVEYSADVEVIGVNLDRFEDIIGMADSDDEIEFTLDGRTRKLHIHFGGLEYTMAVIDPDSIRQEPDIPELDLTAEIVLSGKDINRAVTASQMVSDHVALGIDADSEVFQAEAEGDTDDVNLSLTDEDVIDLSPGAAYSLFSLDYLEDINKAIPKQAEVTMELGEEFPVKMHYTHPDSGIKTTFMIAPRIQSD